MIELPVVGNNPPPLVDAGCICESCGVEFPRRTRGKGDSNRCCSRACGFELLRRERGIARDARLAELRLTRQAARQRTCAQCSAPFEAQPTAKFCSARCGNRHANQIKVGRKAQCTCIECRAQFTPTYGDKRRKYCSDQCAARHSHRISKGMARAAVYGVEAEPINPIAIMERDGWCCHICGGHAPRDLRGTFEADAPRWITSCRYRKAASTSRRTSPAHTVVATLRRATG